MRLNSTMRDVVSLTGEFGRRLTNGVAVAHAYVEARERLRIPRALLKAREGEVRVAHAPVIRDAPEVRVAHWREPVGRGAFALALRAAGVV